MGELVLASYTPHAILDILVGPVMTLLMLFGITLVGVGGFFFLRVFREYFRAKPFSKFEKKAAAAIQAVEMGWVAIACGPLLGFFVCLIELPFTLYLKKPDDDPFEPVQMLFITTGLVAV